MTVERFEFTPTRDFSFSARFGSSDYTMHMIWLDISEAWVVSLYSKGKSVTQGRVVVNDKNLLGNISGAGNLYFSGDTPSLSNIGEKCYLYWSSQ